MTMNAKNATTGAVQTMERAAADVPQGLSVFQRAELWIRGAARAQYEDESGMSTIEYALGCVAAAALGALLYTVVTSDSVESALSGVFERALSEGK